MGREVSGMCMPQPTCSAEIVYMAALTVPLKDESGRRCAPDEFLIFKGHPCEDFGAGEQAAIKWTFAESPASGGCKFEWPRASCGILPKRLKSRLTPGLPSSCLQEPAKPRCSDDISYMITANRELQVSFESAEGVQMVEFRGRRCGYDLIEWHSWRSVSRRDAPWHSFQLGCGQVSIHQQLPTSCVYVLEPAIFEIYMDNVKWIHKYFDNGEMTVSDSDGVPQFAGASIMWQTDGTYLALQAKWNDKKTHMVFRRLSDDGSNFQLKSSQMLLTARGTLPTWWSFKFPYQQQKDFPQVFNADKLVGCSLAFDRHGSCYKIRFMRDIFLTSNASAECAREPWDMGRRWKYVSSGFGVQVYQGAGDCLPLAAHKEIHLEVVDTKGLPHIAFTVTESLCRTSIRIVADTRPFLEGCKNVYKEAWEKGI